MVSLTVPVQSEIRYFLYHGFLIGPCDQFGSSVGETIVLPSDMAYMEESRGIWHDNNVLHNKIEGDVRYHSILGGASRIPVGDYPKYYDYTTFPIYNYLGNPGSVSAYYGPAFHRTSSWRMVASNAWLHCAIERDEDDPSLWTVYDISGTGLTRTSTWIAHVYQIEAFTGLTGSAFKYNERKFTRSWAVLANDGINWYARQTFDTIKDQATRGTAYSQTLTALTAVWYTARVPDDQILSPSVIKGHIDAIAAQLQPEDFPIDDVPYGDLAMKATEKVNANHVNMIAFLRDLRHPTEMIPKLANLSKLKTLTHNYLTVNYGILPTVGDISSIVDACKRLAPYLDRNGFCVYNAKADDSLDYDGISYTKEQRIKVAIENEDSELLSLIKRLDSWGTLPTFVNIWDLVPYSFVLDWLIDVGGLLKRVDTRLRIMRLNIRYATMSRKTTVQGTLTWDSDHPYTGNVRWEQYHRWVSDQCPVPPLSLQTTFQSFNHWLESGALLTQRIKR